MATDRKVWDLAGPSPVTMAVRPSATSIGRGALAMKTGECGVSPAGEVLAQILVMLTVPEVGGWEGFMEEYPET